MSTLYDEIMSTLLIALQHTKLKIKSCTATRQPTLELQIISQPPLSWMPLGPATTNGYLT